MPNELNHVTSILTLDADAQLETPQSKADLIWHADPERLPHPENPHREAGRHRENGGRQSDRYYLLQGLPYRHPHLGNDAESCPG